MRYGILQKISVFFFFLFFFVQTNFFFFFFFFVITPRLKVSPVRGILQLVFCPSFESCRLRSILQTYSMSKIHCFFTSIKLDTSNVFNRITTRVFALTINNYFLLDKKSWKKYLSKTKT